jgi:hypothetical protein
VHRLRRRLGQVDGERGSALVEFGFIALVVWVPLIYIVAGFSAVQRGVFASTAAAREAGRAMATAPEPATGPHRALRAALAVEDRAVDATDVRLAYAAAGVGCAAGRRRVHTDAHAGGGVLDVRDADRADPDAAGGHRRQHRHRPVPGRARPLRRRPRRWYCRRSTRAELDPGVPRAGRGEFLVPHFPRSPAEARARHVSGSSVVTP